MPRGSCWPPLRQTGEDNWVVPASHGSAPSNRIWNITILLSLKQQIWLRNALCGGWCRHMALRNRELHARNDDDNMLLICDPCRLCIVLFVKILKCGKQSWKVAWLFMCFLPDIYWLCRLNYLALIFHVKWCYLILFCARICWKWWCNGCWIFRITRLPFTLSFLVFICTKSCTIDGSVCW